MQIYFEIPLILYWITFKGKNTKLQNKCVDFFLYIATFDFLYYFINDYKFNNLASITAYNILHPFSKTLFPFRGSYIDVSNYIPRQQKRIQHSDC